MLTSGSHQNLSITWAGLCYFLWPELCPDWGGLGPGMDLWTLQPVSVLLRELRVQRRSACRIWNHTDSSWLWPLPPSWEIWLTSFTCKSPKLGFCLSHKHSLCSWHFLSSSWIKDHSLWEKPAEASVTHPKVKVKALCQVLIRQKPSVPGLERQIMKKTKNKPHNFWLSIISNVRFYMYIFAIISPPLLILTL